MEMVAVPNPDAGAFAMSRIERFHYRPLCQAPGCQQPAVYKVAAPWSDRHWTELKNYGVSCGAHAQEQLEAARQKQRDLHLAKGEQVHQARLYRLDIGRRDAELLPVSESA